MQRPPLDGHLGPFPVKGTLTAAQRSEIKEKTGCSPAIRERGQWGQRMLTVTGPCDKLQEAHGLALRAVEENGVTGGRAPESQPQPQPQSKAGAAPRSNGWKSWWASGGWHDRHDYQDWPTRAEVDSLHQRMDMAEYRLGGLEGWYWWCNSGSSTEPSLHLPVMDVEMVPGNRSTESTGAQVHQAGANMKAAQPGLPQKRPPCCLLAPKLSGI